MQIIQDKVAIAVFENIHQYPIERLDYAAIGQAFKTTGLVLLRDWNFDTLSFQLFTQHFCQQFHAVGIRHNLKNTQGDGYSTEVFRDNFFILGHSEGSYKPQSVFPVNITCPPHACFFMCLIAPSTLGGETTLIDGCDFLKLLSKPLRTRFQNEGIIYRMVWDAQRWQNEFHLQDLESLQQLLVKTPNIQYSFQGDTLELFCHINAITPTLYCGDAFATALLAHLSHITHPNYQDKMVYSKTVNRVFFGNGEEISDTIINELIDIHDALQYKHCWQANDVLFIDNTRYLHGRTMTAEPCPRTLLSRFGWLNPNNTTL
ncbi:MAG: TauD/TfdA family dioxygenase [Methylococcaceae bacterium]